MRRSGIKIMGGLMKLVRPLLHVMLLCIILGVAGYACAIAITVLAAVMLLICLGQPAWGLSFGSCAALMICCALARGMLRYGEQTCGHYVAFRLLAIMRDKVFAALRRLAPARLEGRDRGNLISLITGDIEQLEVFYAHTIAPICIAVIVSAGMSVMIGGFHPLLGCLAAVSYLIVGCLIPTASARMGKAQGMAAREKLGGLSSYYLESLRGIRETLQYGQDEKRAGEIARRTEELNRLQGGIKEHEGMISALSGAAVMIFTIGMLGAGLALGVPFRALLLTTVMLSASFGPVIALANLSAALDQTLASGERVLSLLEEEPETEEIAAGLKPAFAGAAVNELSFSYADEEILHNLSLDFPQGEIVAVTGRSGSGKSTLLKLLMRFWQADAGIVSLSGTDVNHIQTAWLRETESYMTQDTDLFHDSIADNIRIGRGNASMADVEEAARKASLHDFIMTLPQGYDTPVGELGETLSGGERQRIGLARAFLHDAPFMLLDEPTSNLDSLNEGIILKALQDERAGRTVVIVSHRKSTLAAADRVCRVESGRLS